MKTNAQYYQFKDGGFTTITMPASNNACIIFDFRDNSLNYTTGTPMDLTWLSTASVTQIYLDRNTSLAGVDVTGCDFALWTSVSCTTLTMVDQGGGSTTEVDFANMTNLQSVDMNNTRQTTTDVSGCTALTTLKVQNNSNQTTISIGTISALTTFWCFTCASLSKVDTGATAANTCDLGNSLGYTQAWGYGCAFNDLIIPAISVTTNVDFRDNNLTNGSSNRLDISAVTGNLSLYLSGNTNLVEVDVGSMTSLVIFSLNVSDGTAYSLARVFTSGTALGTFDFSAMASMTQCYVENTAAQVIDITGCTSLSIFHCNDSTSLTEIDVSTISALDTFYCYDCTSLTKIDTGATGANTADCSNFTSVTDLRLNNCGFSTSVSIPTSNATENIQVQDNSLGSAACDTIVGVIWANRNNYTFATPSLSIGGTNTDPGGIYQAQCPPTTALEEVYELVNDSCAEGFNTWSISY